MHPYSIMAIAWIAVAIWIGLVIFMNRKVHPKALFFLFFAEFWERFSYYGMRALLVLYMVSSLKYAKKDAYGVYAAYGAMVYATPILGGLIAEKLFGYRKAILWGGILMALGHFAMAFEHPTIFFLALSLLIVGNGFFKPNISSFISTFYEKNDPRKDGAYTLFYMGINAGAFLTPLTCGTIGELAGWHYGFGLAGIGMVLGLAVFWYGQMTGVFEENGGPPSQELLKEKKYGLPNEWMIYLATAIALPLIILLIQNNTVLDVGLGILGVSMLGFVVFLGFNEKEKEQGQRLWVIVVLLLFTTLFWSFFELAGSAITLYTKENVNRVVFGQELTTSMFQGVNPLFIILLAPAFTWIWDWMNKKGIEPSAPLKFSMGLLLLGVGFFAFTLGEGFALKGMVPVFFLIFAYLLHTLGELCISPVGLSLVTKLAPTRIVGLIMGIWFLSSSIAHQAGKFVANLTATGDTSKMDAVGRLAIYTGVFTKVGIIAIASGVLLLLLTPIIRRWMHGIR